jgi:hypothetical protein
VAEPRTFEFAVADGKTPEDLLAQARQQARGAGIALAGDATQGTFRGTAAGTYTVVGRTLRVEVTDKPGFVPWGMVEGALKRLFS